ncbi:MAG: hypothetical protein IPJ74_06410 [Saprospiraceae bacterium]|nr:hypothetical protein [Saprospiraceae bacterium]
MESKILDRAGQLFRTEMPEADSLDGYITAILPKVRAWSEDLREEQFYLARPWMEIRDDDSFHELILHFFNGEGEYIKSVDGEVEVGSWRHQNNKLMIMDKDGEEGELFDLTYLDGQFFILKKSGGKGYLFLALEPIGRPLKDRWLDLIEMLFKKSQSNISFYIIIAIAILLALAILLVLR